MFAGYHLTCGLLLAAAIANAPKEPLSVGPADIPTDVSQKLEALVRQTFSSNARQRAQAAKAIGEMHEQGAAAVPFLIQLLDDYDLDEVGAVHYYVDDALLAVGEPAFVACLKAANTLTGYKQSRAIVCLGKFKSPQAVDELLKLLASWDHRSAVAWALGECGDQRATLPLVEILSDSDSRQQVIRALGRLHDSRAVPALLQTMRAERVSEWQRGLAAQSLGMIGDPSTFPFLIETLQDRDAPTQVRCGAALGIGEFHSSADELIANDEQVANSFTLLAHFVRNADEPKQVRIAAAKALAELGKQDAIPLLTEVAISQGSDPLGFWAAVGVVKLTDGNVGDSRVTKSISGYWYEREGNGEDMHEQYNSLKKIAEHESIVGYLIALGIGLIAITFACLIIRRRRASA